MCVGYISSQVRAGTAAPLLTYLFMFCFSSLWVLLSRLRVFLGLCANFVYTISLCVSVVFVLTVVFTLNFNWNKLDAELLILRSQCRKKKQNK